MFRRMFGPDSDLMIVMTWITDCIFLSFFWILGCIPVVTIGASTAALYDATFYAYRKRSKHSWGRFWRSYLKNLKSSILPGIVYLAILIAGGQCLIWAWNDAVNQGNWIGFAAAATVGAVVLGTLSLVFPMLSRFENGFGQLLSNTLRLSLANLPRIMALAVINGAVMAACVMWIVPVMLLPALGALLSTLFIEPIFKPYLPEDFYEIISEA